MLNQAPEPFQHARHQAQTITLRAMLDIQGENLRLHRKHVPMAGRMASSKPLRLMTPAIVLEMFQYQAVIVRAS